MRQTEVTVQVFDSMENVLSQLGALGYEVVGNKKMCDYYYTALCHKAIQDADYATLIKSSIILRDLTDGKFRKQEMIYKDKTLDNFGNVVSEEKLHEKIESIDNVRRMFERWGLTCWCTLMDSMTVCRKDDVEFVLQSVEGLGVFIELEELPDMRDWTDDEKIDELKLILKNVGLKLGEDYSCKKPYMLFEKEKNECGRQK